MNRTSMRKAGRCDCRDLFKWRNDPITRKNSLSGTKKVSFADHKKWFVSKIKSADSILYIAGRGRRKLGLVRFDIKKDYLEVGVNVAPEFRGMGVGKRIMGMGVARIRRKTDKPIMARIRTDNIASIKMCCANGYKIVSRVKGIAMLRHP